MSDELTTAEMLVVEVVTARALLGHTSWTFDNQLWIRPQLESLQNRGLLAWRFDERANFEVTPTSLLRQTYINRSGYEAADFSTALR